MPLERSLLASMLPRSTAAAISRLDSRLSPHWDSYSNPDLVIIAWITVTKSWDVNTAKKKKIGMDAVLVGKFKFSSSHPHSTHFPYTIWVTSPVSPDFIYVWRCPIFFFLSSGPYNQKSTLYAWFFLIMLFCHVGFLVVVVVVFSQVSIFKGIYY